MTYAYVFTSDPVTLDYTFLGMSALKQITIIIDGLLKMINMEI